jgi:hypothetical protein
MTGRQMASTVDRPAPAAVVPRAERGSRRWADRLRTRPGRLVITLFVLTLLVIAAAVSAFVTTQGRAGLVDTMNDANGTPDSVIALQIYRSLSGADQAATSAFLTGGVEPRDLRSRYQQDIATAADAIAVAMHIVEDARALERLRTLATGVPVYTGLVESARSANRLGKPVGVAYLREASALMRTKLLPVAEELYRTETVRLADSQRRAAVPPWVALVLFALTTVALVGTQVYLTRRTNRVVNIGLLLATVVALAVGGWVAVASVQSARSLDAGRETGAIQARVATARIAGQQARTLEALTLVSRGNGAVFEEDFKVRMAELIGADGEGGLLREIADAARDPHDRTLVETARQNARQWREVHVQLRQLDDTGQFPEAVKLATGTENGEAAALFNALDNDLEAAIARHSKRFSTHTSDADRDLSWLPAGVSALSLLMLVGVVVGLWPRIAEFWPRRAEER